MFLYQEFLFLEILAKDYSLRDGFLMSYETYAWRADVASSLFDHILIDSYLVAFFKTTVVVPLKTAVAANEILVWELFNGFRAKTVLLWLSMLVTVNCDVTSLKKLFFCYYLFLALILLVDFFVYWR